ncbi:MAG TPA: threonine/serine dehydratase [Bryobacteraceae bacterium]|jgi:threonine dehydratase|nr:threonine/serine dehydratase [Bryobacteraceae bacterium]
MPITLQAAQEARSNLAGFAIRTPLIRLNTDDHDIYLKLENLQPICSFKIRGASNAIAHTPKEQLAKGLLTASAGNMAQGVAYCARRLGIPATVIAPDTAPETKLRAIERLGGRVIKAPFDQWWRSFETRSFPGIEATFIHAFDDPHVMAGNGTIGLELIEDLPDLDAVIVPWGGGGLACGIASIVKTLKPSARVYAAEAETAAPLAASLKAGAPQTVDYRPSWVDGIGSKTVFEKMFTEASQLLDGSIVVTLEEAAQALKLAAERNRIIVEGAAACALAAAKKAGPGKIVAIISGGNIDLTKFTALISA